MPHFYCQNTILGPILNVKKRKSEKRILKSNNEKRITKKRKMKKKRRVKNEKNEKQTNFTLLSNIELAHLA